MTDAKLLFEQTTFDCSRLITQRYSTSFTLGIKTLHRKYRKPIYAIYGFVRCADEIVDTFHNYDRKALLSKFKEDTYLAIREGISLNPVLHAFQRTVNRYHISLDLIESFLRSMEMDLDFTQYNDEMYNEYIYGSAEVVGLMCLKVFCEGNEAEYQRLRKPACKLGAAFQKVNFLRDIKSDFEERGRVYFPGVDFQKFDGHIKIAIENDIQKDFDEALLGIQELPKGAVLGVKIAYLYYLNLFYKIKGVDPNTITHQRIRIPNARKISLLLKTYFSFKLGFS